MNLNLSDNLRPTHDQGKHAERDVDLSPSDTVNNLRDLGFDFAAIVEADYHLEPTTICLGIEGTDRISEWGVCAILPSL